MNEKELSVLPLVRETESQRDLNTFFVLVLVCLETNTIWQCC